MKRHHAGLWSAIAILSLLLLGLAVFAAATREDPPMATVHVNESVSLDLVGVLTQTNRRVDLSPLSRRLFWKLPRPLRTTVFACGRPAPSQMVRAFDIGPQDVKLVFVANGSDGDSFNGGAGGVAAQEKVGRALANAGMDHVRLTNGTDWQSEAVYLREEPLKGQKIIRTVQIEDVPTTVARVIVEFVGRPGAEDTEGTAGTQRVEIVNPHF